MRAIRALDRSWFAPMSPTPLALLRIVIGLAAFVALGPRLRPLLSIADSPLSAFDSVGVVALLDAPIPRTMFALLLAGALLANVAFVLGWRLSFTGPLFAGLFLWIVTYRSSWSVVYHADNLIALHLLILGLTRSADALSLDARRRATASRPARGPSGNGVTTRAVATDAWPGAHWEYGYPIRLICAVTVITYVLAGVAKLAGPLGWAWATGEGLQTQLAIEGLRTQLLNGATPGPLAAVVYTTPALAAAVASIWLIVELAAPAALLAARLGWIWAIGAFLLQWILYVVMGTVTWYPLLGLAFASFFVDDRLLSRIARSRSGLVKHLATPAPDDAGMAAI